MIVKRPLRLKMNQLGGLPAGNAADESEVELESLGLGLFDLDADLAECFENCPEWNVSCTIQYGVGWFLKGK